MLLWWETCGELEGGSSWAKLEGLVRKWMEP